MEMKITKKKYLERIINEGAKKVGFVPLSVQKDKSLLKVVLHQDPEVLIFLPDELHTPENFWNTSVSKRYILLAANTINEKIPAKMIEWILDEKTSVVGFPYLQKEFPQFKDFTDSAKKKFVISCMIEGRKVPDFAENYAGNFSQYSISELKDYKEKLILMESIGKIIDESENIDSKVNSTNQESTLGNGFKF